MSAPENPSNPDPLAQAPRKRPWGWIAVATLKEGVEATVAALQALQPQCAPALEQG